MIIIFYDANKDDVYICSDKERTKIISIDDPDLMSHIPNDDILYVQNAHFITKKQFGDWLSGESSIVEEEEYEPHRFTGFMDEDAVREPSVVRDPENPYKGSLFIHPKHNGTIIINDISTPKYPNGVQMNGKWDFIPIDHLGGEGILEESQFFKGLLAKGKIEVVDYEYVKKNKHKKHQKSLKDVALDAIIVKDDRSGAAESVAAAGGIHASDSGVIEIFVE